MGVGGWLEKLRIRLTSASTEVGVEVGAELGNFDDIDIDENGDIIAEEEDDEDIYFSATYKKSRKGDKYAIKEK